MLHGTSVFYSFPSFSTVLSIALCVLGAAVYYRNAQMTAKKQAILMETAALRISSDGTEKKRSLSVHSDGNGQSRESASRTLRIRNLTDPALIQASENSSVDSAEVPINPSEPYAFENEFVYGKLLFLLVQEKEVMPPLIQRLFEGKRRLFWIQMQIRFKKSPSGPLFIGGEVPHSMNLGFFTQGLTKLLLRILNSLLSGLHYGFGAFYKVHPKVTQPEDEELPHICFPLYTSVDQFVCTSNDETPPSLGSLDFGESKQDSLTRRKSNDIFYAFQTNYTYSFHFHSYFLNFARWKLVNVPGVRETALESFWSDMPLRLVAYSLNDIDTSLSREKAIKTTRHTAGNKEYHFSFELCHSSKPQRPSGDPRGSSDDSRGSMELTQSETSEDTEAFIPQEISVPVWLEYITAIPGESLIMERWVGYVLLFEGKLGASSCSRYVFCTALEAFEPLQSMEMRSRIPGKGPETSFKPFKGLNSVSIRSYRRKYKRIGEERVFLQQKLREILHCKANDSDQKKAKKALWSLMRQFGQNTFSFFQSNTSDKLTFEIPQPAKVLVLRAVKRTFWRMEWMEINQNNGTLEFFRKSGVDASSWSIPLTNVYQLEAEEKLGSSELPQAEIYWLSIVSLQMRHHIGFPSEQSRSTWMKRILSEMEHNGNAGLLCMEKRLTKSIDQVCQNVDLEVFVQPLAPKSCGVRRAVLNDRSHFVPHSKLPVVDALDFLAGLLDQLTALYSVRNEECSILKLLEFLDALEILKTTPLRQHIGSMAPLPRENFKKTYFLNLFHLLILNACLFRSIIPKKLKQWSRFFNGISYCVDGIYFSLAEIEHCVIRAPMSSLRLPVVKLVLPKKLYGSLEDQTLVVDIAEIALKNPDFRLNFALNCMTRSSLNRILLFSIDELDTQLAAITRAALTVMISYDYDRKTVYLPRVCDWYRYDFAMDGNPRTMIFQCFLPYFEGEQKTLFQSLLDDERGRIARWKFAKYHFGFHDTLRIEATDKEFIVTLRCTNDEEDKRQAGA
ncbi:hypothetical protein ABG067_006796 [Albugo candida]